MSSQQTPTTTHSVETPSGRISYASAGSGPVALFVHGVVLNKHLWRHQLAGLSDIRRCIAVDLLAHGDTEIAPDQRCFRDRQREDAERGARWQNGLEPLRKRQHSVPFRPRSLLPFP